MNSPKPSFLKTIIFGILTVLISTTLCFGQTKTEQLDELLNQYLDYGKFNGSVLVADQGKVMYKKGFGMANMEWDIPNKPNTKHRLGSVTKQFTAMLILQLVAEGKIDLQTPITTYLPDYPKENGDKITTHHLLTHSSGIPNYTAFPDFFAAESRNPYTPDQFVKKFEDKELEFTPGEKFNYSNSGYFLLGVLIEKLSGKTYEEMLHEKIFTPLGMHDTGYDNHKDILKNRATGYEKNGTSFINSAYLDMSIPYAAGSLYSTVEDLYLWDQALYTTTLLPQKYMDLFFTPYIAAFGNSQYAYGWGVGKEVIGNTTDSITVISHGGGINGFNTNISRSPSNKSLVVLLNNTGGAPLGEMTRSIIGIMHGKTYDIPKKSLAYDFLNVIKSKGIKAGLAYYNTNKEGDNFELNENEMNQIGYQLMGNGTVEEAAQVFKLNIDAFPKSPNAYDSYGEALMKLDDTKGAITNYKKSIEINPANQNGIDMLKKLGVNTNDLVKEVVVPEAILKTYIGVYELTPDFKITISKEGNQIKAQATGQPMADIYPKSNEEFYLKVVTAQVIFNKGENGEIESLTLFQGGQEMMGKKME
ncbi:serine hydrolase [Maribacter arcticus]|uniref:CubicO group peptidase, beta-lactamase class C family n=1 Tax=Maribacter arcticus TaxID=561365 RepID=A0A1T5EJ61_9FLAO|nr:serine hydrolase [Maribacter arcticus]SKB83974.1 CubicO group peptidase, beta-lactamase class C family [Maribacter arcticus]